MVSSGLWEFINHKQEYKLENLFDCKLLHTTLLRLYNKSFPNRINQLQIELPYPGFVLIQGANGPPGLHSKEKFC